MTPLSNSLWAIETFVILVFWRRNAWRPFWNQNLGKLQGFCLVYIYLISSKWSITQQNTKPLTQNCLLPPPWSDFIGEFFHWPFEISERKSLAQINATLHAVMRVFYWISRQFYLLNEFLSTSEIFIISFPGFVRTAPSPNDNTPISRSPLPNFVIHPKLGRVTLRLTWLLTASQLVLVQESPE